MGYARVKGAGETRAGEVTQRTTHSRGGGGRGRRRARRGGRRAEGCRGSVDACRPGTVPPWRLRLVLHGTAVLSLLS
eukprot:1457214-Rhodomonas_salina.1